MKTIISIFIIFLLGGIARMNAQCGSSYFFSQEDIDSFAIKYPTCQYMGIVDISGGNGPITNLNGFSNLTHIGKLKIFGTQITSLAGLDYLEKVGSVGSIGISIIGNEALVNLSGLNNLDTVFGKIDISGNMALTTLSGLNNLKFCGDISILSNHQLSSLTGLENLTSMDDLFIAHNSSLLSFTGLDNLTTMDDFYLYNNDALTSFSGLGNISAAGDIRIETNDALPNLNGLFKLKTAESVSIINNNFLTSLYGLDSLTTSGSFFITDNNALWTLSGLDNLNSTDNFNMTNNDALIDLSAMGNLDSVRHLVIKDNLSLNNLGGLENIDYTTMTYLAIINNPNLSICSIESVCNYLANSSSAQVYGNKVGCLSMAEIESFCYSWYEDIDGDGYGNSNTSKLGFAQPTGYVSDDTDCDDNNPAINPGATEICDGIDNDCNEQVDDVLSGPIYYYDLDNDGYGNPTFSIVACTSPPGYVSNDSDCDDFDPAIHPGATESCNGLDDNCDGQIDEGFSHTTFYYDFDGDGFGNPAFSTVEACSNPPGLVSNNLDCDDYNSATYPGATESCNGFDDNCDGQIDEGFPTTIYYFDGDGDGYGAGPSYETCQSPSSGYVAVNGDCNDNNLAINPAATELWNGIDDNCNGQIDEGFPNCTIDSIKMINVSACNSHGNCDPLDDTFSADIVVHYSNPPQFGDLIIIEYFGGIYVSIPTSSIGPSSFTLPSLNMQANGQFKYFGAVFDPAGCEITTNVGAAPLPCSLVTSYADTDGDSFGDALSSSSSTCPLPSGYVFDNTDCDDNNNTIHPGAAEICNGLDNNCDGYPESAINTWTGNGDGIKWIDPANWSDGIVPLPCQDLVVPASHSVEVNAGETAVGQTLEVAPSAVLSVEQTAILDIKN